MGHFFRNKRNFQQDNKLHKKNDEIRIPSFTLISEDGEIIENCPRDNALKIALEKGLDLVLVSPNSVPPVAKIMDWGKYKYESLKKKQDGKKGQKTTELKEIRLRPKTGPHDIEIKIKKIREFIEKGHKVKIVMMFKGREIAYLEKSKEGFRGLIEKLSDVAKPEEAITFQFRKLSATLAPNK